MSGGSRRSSPLEGWKGKNLASRLAARQRNVNTFASFNYSNNATVAKRTFEETDLFLLYH